MAIQHLLSLSQPLVMERTLVQLMRGRKPRQLPSRRGWLSLVLSLYHHLRMGAGLVTSYTVEEAGKELQLYVDSSVRRMEGRHECFQTTA